MNINRNKIKNPVARAGHDPFVTQKNGCYYYCYSHKGSLWINKHHKLQDAVQFEGKKIWTPEPEKMFSKNIWAPELHFLQEKWYVYFAADDGNNENHRMFVLESETKDPMSNYSFVGKITDPSDRWAIDGTVLERTNKLYFIWSGWEEKANIQQNIYIAEMTDPKTILSPRILISKPDFDWEKIGNPLVNEGPQVLKNEKDVFIIYSASGSWTDNYCLGQLKLIGTDPLNPKSWKKHPAPVFTGTETVFSPGHASFVKSLDGKEDWIVYHTAIEKGAGWKRDVCIKKFRWNEDGSPNFGAPIQKGIEFDEPSE